MAEKKKQYWTADAILSANADINMVLGEKGNGKSYDIKYRFLKRAYETGEKFAYFRRYKEDIRDLDIEEWLADMTVDNSGNHRIKQITKGEWTKTKVFRGEIFFARDDLVTKTKRNGEEYEEIVTTKGPMIGKAFYVSKQGYQHTASHAYVGYTMGIYEEFITSAIQEDDEPDTFMKMISTIFRDNKYTLFLLGNRISRHNPYFRAWQLTGALKQKPGTIETYKETRYDEKLEREIETVLAIEQCPAAGSTAKIFGGIKKSILGTSYDVKSAVPLFRDDYKKFTCMYEILFISDERYLLRAMLDEKTGNAFCLVSAYRGQRDIKRKLQKEFSYDPLTTSRLYDNIEVEKKIVKLLTMGKVCYTDELTGTEFPEIARKFGIIV